MCKIKCNKIILASTSKSRKNILRLAGVKYTALNSGVDEEKTKKNHKGKPRDLALILAKEKAQAISKIRNNCFVIGADQVLSFNGKVFNKQKNLKEAKKNLYIYDLVYKPSQTNLLKEAEINNLNYQNGLAMLVHQAAESFRIWHGVYPEITNELFEILKR